MVTDTQTDEHTYSFLSLRLILMNTVYTEWYQKFIMVEEALECNVLFSKLFQNLQIRSTNEAMAETVGSIMNHHIGKNR